MDRKGKKHKANRTEKRKGTCVYCGSSGQGEDEDVIPKCLFLKPAPDRVIVPSCRPCNAEKSKNDPYLRDMLVVDADRSINPVARAILAGIMTGSLRRGSSLLGRTAVTNARWEPVHTKGGIYVGHAYAAPLEEDRVTRIFSMIVRGLYYRDRNQRLPDDCQFEVLRVRRMDAPKMWETLQQLLGPGGYGTIGKDVFECLYWIAKEDATVTHWVFCFYWGVHITVSTQSPGSFARLGALPYAG